MTLGDIKTEKTSGKISHLGREVILYTLEIPSISDEKFPNRIFGNTAENFVKYLEKLSSREISPVIERLTDEKKRYRDIKRETGIPIKASLVWKFDLYRKKYLSARCETHLEYSNSRDIFTLRTLNFDTDTMILKRAGDFSPKARKHGYLFYLTSQGIFTFTKKRVFASNRRDADEKFGIAICKIDNKRR